LALGLHEAKVLTKELGVDSISRPDEIEPLWWNEAVEEQHFTGIAGWCSIGVQVLESGGGRLVLKLVEDTVFGVLVQDNERLVLSLGRKGHRSILGQCSIRLIEEVGESAIIMPRK
jgi:hypothetical protein